MENLGHGANIQEISNLYNIDPKCIIDFSSNVNKNIIKNANEYLLEALEESRSYPDINYTQLRQNIGKYLGIESRYIIPGNGATEIIYLLMKGIGRRLAILNPTFSEYKRGALLNGLKVLDLNLDISNEFQIDIEDIKKNIDNFDSLFICNPNNPNGKVQELDELLNVMKQNNKILIVDETFMEFVEDEQKYSLVKYIEKYNNLFIIKATTKFFGMPGLRLGYGITSNKEITEKIYKYKEPWTINSFADTLSRYIFEDKEYIKESKSYYIKERSYMLRELKNIQNITVYDTDTNFLLIKLKNKRANEIKVELLKRGKILIRDASNFIGLNDSYIRVAIKSHENNKELINNLKILLGD